MSTNFPSSLDDATTLPVESGSTALATNHVTAHQNMQDAMEAVQAKVGVDSSAVTTSHDYKLSGVTGSDKAVSKTGTETLTNKTLTSPVINVGSDATGDIYYRNAGVLTRLPIGTDNYILKVNGTVPNWEAETATVDASSTVKGVVEIATAAEITAGTATGGTGAVLAISPDQLALSSPAFDGTNITGTSRIGTSATDSSAVTNTVTETTVATIAIPGGVLGTNRAVRFRATFQADWTATNGNITFRAKYGGTTIASESLTGIAGNPTQTAYITVDGVLIANGATGSQKGNALFFASNQTSGTINSNSPNASASIDSTASQNFTFTLQWSAASTSLTAKLTSYVIEKIV